MLTSFRYRTLLVLIPIGAALLSWTGALRHTRDSVSDLLFSARPAPADIVIIAIDEQSIHAIGQWPWPRATFAAALARLTTARTVGIDVNFKEPSRLGIADDQAFAYALNNTSVPVVLASEVQSDGTVIRPISMLAVASEQGLANVTIDPDGIARTVRLERSGVQFLGAKVTGIAQGSDQPVRINFLGPAGTIPSYSATDLLQGRVPASAIAGKIVMIGATAHDLQDYQNTPFGLMSGVEIQSTVTANVLANDFLTTQPVADMVVTFVAALIALALAWYLRKIWVMLALLFVLVALIWIGVFVMFEYGVVMDLVMPTAAVIASAISAIVVRYATTAQERRFIHDTFSRYLAPQVISALMRDPSLVRLGGERRELTILFSDIRGFTTLSETMNPQQLSHFLNRYLGAMTDIILEQKGVIDKYIGDAIMAFWGAPLDDNEQALHSVQSALAMTRALEHFNRESRGAGLPEIAIGIGINTGAVTVGNMGSEKRFDYTAIGDEVNLASRLESLTKTYGVGIIISDNTLRSIDVSGRHGIVVREIDRVRVKGKTQPVTIYEVMTSSRELAAFDQAREYYYTGHWQEAIAAFDRFIATVGSDGPAQLLKERCQGFVHRPADHWEGVFDMQHK